MAFSHRKLIPRSDADTGSNTTDIIPTPTRTSYATTPPPLGTYDPSTEYISPPPHDPKIPPPLKISLIVLVIVFTIFLLYTLYKFYTVCYRSRRRRRTTTGSDPDQEAQDQDFLDQDLGPVVDHPIWYIRTIGLQPSMISSITVVSYKKGEGLVEGTDCSVCLSEFQEDETLRLLPKCNHAFHLPCIDTWLRSHTNCPLCRAGIVGSPENSPSPEQAADDGNLGVVEETSLEVSQNDGEFEREREEDGGFELRIEIIEEENDIVKAEEEESNSNYATNSSDIFVRRSVSLDFPSASSMSAAATANVHQSDGDFGIQLVKRDQTTMGTGPKRVDANQSLLRLMGSSSIGKPLQMGPFSMKRSFSCSGKALFSRHTRREL